MKKQKGAGFFAATVGVSSVVTAGYRWYEVLLGWGIGGCIWLLMRCIQPRDEMHTWKAAEQGTGLILAAGALWVAEEAFPQDSTFPFVSVCLTILLWYSMRGSETGRIAAGNLIGLLMLPMMVMLTGFGCGELDWTQLRSEGVRWQHVAIPAVISLMWGRNIRESWRWYLASGGINTLLCVVTAGRLGAALAEQDAAPLYHAVQTIRLFGTEQRIEALTAAVILMGAYGTLLSAGNLMANEEHTGGKGEKIKYAGLLLLSLLLETAYRYGNQRIALTMATAFWGIMACFALWVVIFEKNAKRA